MESIIYLLNTWKKCEWMIYNYINKKEDSHTHNTEIKRPGTKEYILYTFDYLKYNNKQYWSMLLEAKVVIMFGQTRSDWKWHEEWGKVVSGITVILFL